ncbi:MAG: hypothetical protein Q4F65_07000 [Propionibacteriaceae bacterium]|nr:hypothetical protein [Propionibacteriaceae bacterium]
MTIAPTRGTRAWSNLCAHWQTRINQHNGWTCRRCAKRIPPYQRSAWQLGHPHDMTTGPTPLEDLEPEHCRCNTSAGATAGNTARAGTTEPTWSL